MTFVIAEAGSNHCGELSLVEELALGARDAGADAVKFQACDKGALWTKARPSFIDKRKGWFEKVKVICDEIGIEFMCTPMYPGAVEWLDPLVERWKIAAFDAGRGELLERCLDTGKPVYVSMGLVAPKEVRSYVTHHRHQIIPLHCVTKYPCDSENYAIREWLRAADPFAWGLSDHSQGFGVAAAAISLGAAIYERHFKLFSQPSSPDSGPHALIPSELSSLIALIRDIETALDGELISPAPPAGRKLFPWKGIG